MKRILKFLSLMLLGAIILSHVNIFALSWDGESAGAGGYGSAADVRQFAVRIYPGDNCVGYRFSTANKSGASINGIVVDIFRNTTYGNIAYSGDYKFSSKYNKVDLINKQQSSFQTKKTTAGCYKETDFSFDKPLTSPDGMAKWQNNLDNINEVLKKMKIAGASTFSKGEMVLIEPIYEIMIEGIYHALTVTEIAIYGKYYLGPESDGGSSASANSWGFISGCTNKIYPNSLYTPNGQGLWEGVSALEGREKFKNIINKGYGVGIAYQDKDGDFSPALDVKLVQVFSGSAPDKSHKLGESLGSSFSLYEVSEGYPKAGDKVFFTVYFPCEERDIKVKQSVWVNGVLKLERTVMSSAGCWVNVCAEGISAPDKEKIIITAKVNRIDNDGNVLKYGSSKPFFVPVKPVISNERVELFNSFGEVHATTGKDGKSGVVYQGQRVMAKYVYAPKNDFYTLADLYGAMEKYASSSWVRVAGGSNVDAHESGAEFASYEHGIFSNLGFVYVPDNSASGENVMRFKMTNRWSYDPDRVWKSDTYEINIVKADAEMREIFLTDSSGKRADPTALVKGDTYNIKYRIANNTPTDIFVEVYSGGVNISEGYIYKIEANSSALVDGGEYSLESSSGSISGGVYLEGAGYKNTKDESDGTNNEQILETSLGSGGVKLVPVEPNSSYREGTRVIVAYNFVNGTDKDILPADGYSALFRVYGKLGTEIASAEKTGIVSPSYGKNLIYFPLDIPKGCGGELRISYTLKKNGETERCGEKKYGTVENDISSVPDSRYERDIPSSFVPGASVSDGGGSAGWSEYVYSSGKLVRKDYNVSLSVFYTLSPATGYTAYCRSGKTVMKSGYGISLSAKAEESGSYPSGAVTDIQYASLLLPEYAYSKAPGCFLTLDGTSDGGYTLRKNGAYGRVHFIPLYYPDGPYSPALCLGDLWTPAGMINYTKKFASLVIEGSAYDDWYIGRE